MKNFMKEDIVKDTGRSLCAHAFILGYTKSFFNVFGRIALGPYGLLLSAPLSCCNA